MVKLLVVLALSLAAACGARSLRSPAPPPPPPPGSLPPLPRSSIAAVLEHREELKLTADQVRRLEELDEKLAARNAALREGPANTDKPAAAPPAGGSAAPSQRGGMTMSRGGRGGGMGTGGGSRGAPRQSSSSEDSRNPESLEQRMDDNDTRAYLDAEAGVLNPDQRDRARDIAEDYREKLYDRRELLGRHRGRDSP